MLTKKKQNHYRDPSEGITCTSHVMSRQSIMSNLDKITLLILSYNATHNITMSCYVMIIDY